MCVCVCVCVCVSVFWIMIYCPSPYVRSTPFSLLYFTSFFDHQVSPYLYSFIASGVVPLSNKFFSTGFMYNNAAIFQVHILTLFLSDFSFHNPL